MKHNFKILGINYNVVLHFTVYSETLEIWKPFDPRLELAIVGL